MLSKCSNCFFIVVITIATFVVCNVFYERNGRYQLYNYNTAGGEVVNVLDTAKGYVYTCRSEYLLFGYECSGYTDVVSNYKMHREELEQQRAEQLKQKYLPDSKDGRKSLKPVTDPELLKELNKDTEK